MRFLALCCLFLCAFQTHAKLCNPTHEQCWTKGRNSSGSPAYPSKNSNIKINPSAVPLEKVWGGELMYYDGDADFAIVRGLGRVGAAISPSNGEETFFGPMGFEEQNDFLERMTASEKYESQKITLAGAVGLWGNKKAGMRRLQLNLGIIAKYNKESEEWYPGAGFSVVAGPLTLGYSYSNDNFYLAGDPTTEFDDLNFKYQVETLSAGIFLNSIAVDYSHMRVHFEDSEMATINLLTGSLLLSRCILTMASRHESSDRPQFDYKTKALNWEREKFETFGGVQFSVTKVMMVGLFHNYYLLRELSLGMTLFF